MWDSAAGLHACLDFIQDADAVGAQVHDLQAAAGAQLRRQAAQLVVPQPQLRQRRAARQVAGAQAPQLQAPGRRDESRPLGMKLPLGF